jgi:hypothetical protein
MFREGKLDIRATMKDCLVKLNAAQLTSAINTAKKHKKIPNAGLNQNGHFRGGGAESFFTGIADFMKGLSEKKITDENALDVLDNILSQSKESDAKSFNYLLVSQLYPVNLIDNIHNEHLMNRRAAYLVELCREEIDHLKNASFKPFSGISFTLGD